MKNKIIKWLMLRAWTKMLKFFDEYEDLEDSSFFMCFYARKCSSLSFIKERMLDEIKEALGGYKSVYGMILHEERRIPNPPYLYCNMWRERFIMSKIKEYS